MNRRAIVVAAAGVAAAAAGAILVLGGSDDASSSKPAGSVTVFASSPLRAPFTQIAKQFESANDGVRVVLRFGASRALLARTRPGHPGPGADVLATSDNGVIHDLSGNAAAADLEAQGNPSNATIFLHDALVIVTAPGDPRHVTALGDLAKQGIRVVLGRPGTRVGTVARDALAKGGVTVAHPSGAYDATGVVRAVTSGRADAGIVYGSDASAAGGRVAVIEVPDPQDAVAATYYVAQPTDTRHRRIGERFMTFLFGTQAQKALTDAGFEGIGCSAQECGPGFGG